MHHSFAIQFQYYYYDLLFLTIPSMIFFLQIARSYDEYYQRLRCSMADHAQRVYRELPIDRIPEEWRDRFVEMYHLYMPFSPDRHYVINPYTPKDRMDLVTLSL